MEKIEIKSKNPSLSVSIGMDDLCNVLVNLPMKQRIHIINHILEYHCGKESPLKALAEQRYKDAIKEVKVFKNLTSNPDMPAKEAYKSVAEKYEKRQTSGSNCLILKMKTNKWMIPSHIRT